MVDFEYKNNYNIIDLINIVKLLRSENGCPWDKEQTHHSIRNNFIEETYEVIEAIDNEDANLLCEELGDVLLQVVFHASLSEQENNFDFEKVCDGICKKLIIRHPHVFSDVKVSSTDDVLKNWDSIKMKTKIQKNYTETLENVPKVLPSLIRSEKILSRAIRAGKDYDETQAISNIKQNIENIALKEDNQKIIGKLLFSCVMLAKKLNINPEEALYNTCNDFINNFSNQENNNWHKENENTSLGINGIYAL